jgi:hypothetical protein
VEYTEATQHIGEDKNAVFINSFLEKWHSK